MDYLESYQEKTKAVWAIVGTCGLYTGTWLTRQAAIQEHCSQLLWGTSPLGKPDGTMFDLDATIKNHWRKCRRRGDRAVRVYITYPQFKI